MKTKRILLVLCALAVLALGAMSAGAQDSLIQSVCLVTDVGRVNDATFNQFAYEGMLRAAEDFSLDTTFIETTAQTDYETNIQTCLDEGYDAIITVGFMMTDTTVKLAADNPAVYFIGVDQFVMGVTPNLVGLQFREDQSGFLVGVMAAMMTQSGTIAGVYGMEIPPVVKFRNGFEQGALFQNPDLVIGETILGVYIDSFTAPDRGQAAAEQFAGQGADVIFGAGGQTGSGGITWGAQNGLFVIGVDQDEYFTTFGSGATTGADMLITSAVKRVDQAVYLSLQALVDGDTASFHGGGIRVFSALNDGVGFAPAHDAPVPDDVTARVQEVFDGLKAGTIVTGVDPVLGGLLPNIVEVATTAGTFNTLLAAATAAGLVDTLTNGGPFTVFAPTDEAFAALLAELGMDAGTLLADTELLTAVLTYHVLPVALPAEAIVLSGGGAVDTVAGVALDVSFDDMGGVLLNGTVHVVATDIYAANGIIHVIDAVLLPPEG